MVWAADLQAGSNDEELVAETGEAWSPLSRVAHSD